MTEEEAVDYRSGLAAALGKCGVGWITEQAQEKIALGKLESKRIDASEPVVDAISRTQRRSSRKSMAEFLFTVEYTEVQKLTILIEAIESALILPVKTEQAVPQNLGSEIPISFISDEGAPQFTHGMRPQNDSARAQATDELTNTLANLKALL